jgi:hypothetical protein
VCRRCSQPTPRWYNRSPERKKCPGTIIAPQLVGFLSDAFAPGHVANGESLRLAMLCLVPFGFWSAWHYFRSSRKILDDQERATGVRPA